MNDEHEDIDDQAVRDARAAEYIRQFLGKTLDVFDVEVRPPTAARGPRSPLTMTFTRLSRSARRVLHDPQELVEAGLGAAILLGELNDPLEDPGNAT
jgi:hypothetical protein